MHAKYINLCVADVRMGNAHTHDRRKSGAPETGLTIEGIREKPLHQHERKQGRVEKKVGNQPSSTLPPRQGSSYLLPLQASPPSFRTAEGEAGGGEVELGSTVEEIQSSPRPARVWGRRGGTQVTRAVCFATHLPFALQVAS